MKGEIRNPLALAERTRQRAVAPGVSAEEYLAILRDSVPGSSGKQKYKQSTGLHTFRRWLRLRGYLESDEFQIDEEHLFGMREEMRSGAFRKRDGRWYAKAACRYVPSSIVRLHNSAYKVSPVIERELVNMMSYERYRYFNTLTDTTLKALVWFERNATHASARKGTGRAPRLLTVSTRNAGVNQASAILRQLGLQGLEEITEDHVDDFLGLPDADDPGYRYRVRMMGALKPVFRSCVERGLLPRNPVLHTPNDTFDTYAHRDFLPPDQLGKLLDLQTVDRSDLRQVRDRLLCLLYVDSALRRNELAGLELDQFRRCEDGTYEIWLATENQKMSGKPAVILPLLYPQTQELLELYLREYRPKFDCTGLAVNDIGRRALGGWCGKAVVREGERIGLETYLSKTAPRPHDLRRTFGTCNARPLGFAMGVEELAQRLRDGIDVVYKHHIVNNPLITRHRADEYRKRASQLAGCEHSQSEINATMAVLGDLGIDSDLLAQVREKIAAKQREKEDREHSSDDEPTWIEEDAAFGIFEKEWGELPRSRALQKFAKDEGIARSKGPGRHVWYDEKAVRGFASEYRPFPRDYDDGTATQRGLRHKLSAYKVVRIGNWRFLQKDDLIRLLGDLRTRR